MRVTLVRPAVPADDKFQAEKPSLDDLIASGDYDGPFRLEDVIDPNKQAAPSKADTEAN